MTFRKTGTDIYCFLCNILWPGKDNTLDVIRTYLEGLKRTGVKHIESNIMTQDHC